MSLMLYLAVQLDHMYGSEQLLLHLSRLGFCLSVDEVTRCKQSVMKHRSESLAFPGSGYGAQFVADNVDHNVRTLDGYDTFHGMGIISACLRDGNFAAVNPKLPQLKSRMTAKNLCSGQGVPIRVYSKMFGVGIDHLHLKSVHSLMRPVFIPPVVSVSSLWDVCMATYTRPNWSGFMQTVCVGEHESTSN